MRRTIRKLQKDKETTEGKNEIRNINVGRVKRERDTRGKQKGGEIN